MESACKRGLIFPLVHQHRAQPVFCLWSLCLCFCADVPACKTRGKICQHTFILTGFLLHKGERLALYVIQGNHNKEILGTIKSNEIMSSGQGFKHPNHSNFSREAERPSCHVPSPQLQHIFASGFQSGLSWPLTDDRVSGLEEKTFLCSRMTPICCSPLQSMLGKLDYRGLQGS